MQTIKASLVGRRSLCPQLNLNWDIQSGLKRKNKCRRVFIVEWGGEWGIEGF